MANERNVDVVIRARDEATDNIKGFVRTIGAAAKSQQQLTEELEQTDKRFQQLSESARSIAGSLSALKQTASTAAQFAKLNAQVGELNSRLEDNKSAAAQAAQTQQQAAAAASRAAAEYTQLRTALAALKAEQSDVAVRQKQLAATLKTAVSFDKLTSDVSEYEAALRKAELAGRALATSQSNLQSRLAQVNKTLALPQEQRSVPTKQLELQRKQLEKDLAAVDRAISKNTSQQSGLEVKLQGVITRMEALGAAAAKSGVDLRELNVPISTLEAEMASLNSRASEFAGRMAPVSGALNNAKIAATGTAAELKQADAALASSERQYAQTGAKVAELTGKLQPLESELKQAGVATGNLAAEQDRLQSEINQTNRELRNADGTLNKYARAANQAAGANENFLEKGRKALSFSQRLRGQVLSLVSAYVGLYGAISQVTKAFEVGSKLQGTRNTLVAANNGDTQAAAAEFEYTQQLAAKLGQELVSLSNGYAKLRVASKDSGISLNSTRLIFESLTEAATVNRLSAEQTERVFTAVTQIFSKGKISAEELTQQLGDSLPGATNLLAKGLGITTAQLAEMMKAGELTSSALIALGLEARKTYAAVTGEAVKSPTAELNRLKNNITELRDLFFQTAEQNGLAAAIRQLADELKKPEIQEGVQGLAKGFVALIEATPRLIKLLDDLLPYLQAFGAWVGGKLVGGIVAASAALAKDFTAAATIATGAATRLAAAVNVLVGSIAVGLTTYSLTTWAREEFDGFRYWTDRLGNFLVYTVDLIAKGIINLANIYGNAIADLTLAPVRALQGKDIFADTRKAYEQFLADLKANQEGWEAGVEFAGVRDPKPGDAPIDPNIEAAKIGNELMLQQQQEFAAEFEMQQNMARDRQKAADEAAAKDKAKRDKAAAAERIKLAEQVRDALLENEAKLQEKLADLSGDPAAVLEARLATIDEQYRELYEKLAKLGDMAGKARLDAIVAQEKALASAQSSRRGGLSTDLADKLAEATGNGVQVELAKLRAEYEQTVAQLKLIGDANGQEIAKRLLGVEEAKVQLDKLLSDYDAVMDRFQTQQQALSAQVEVGDKTQMEAQIELNRLRQESLLQIQAMIPEMQRLAAAIGDPAIIAKVEQTKLALVDLRRTGIEATERQINESFASGLTNALGDWITGIQDAKTAFRQFASDFLRQIAQMIIQQQILNMLKAMGGPFSGLAGAAAPVAHSGAIVGRSTGRTRRVNPDIFAGASRYHSGGMVGLRPDEVPAILQRGEEVLSRRDPRNAMNGGAGGSSPLQVKVVNTIDAGDFVSQGMNTAQGQEAILNVIRANKGAF